MSAGHPLTPEAQRMVDDVLTTLQKREPSLIDELSYNYLRLIQLSYGRVDGSDVNLSIRHIDGGNSEQKMEMNQTSNRIHPLMAGAAASVMLVSLVGAAAIIGVLPNSHSTVAPMASAAPTAVAATANVPAVAATPYQYAAQAPAVVTPVVHHKHVTHHAATVYSQAAPSTQYAQASSNDSQPYPQPVPQPIQQPIQPPAAQHSTVGIATGAVLGGLLGNQVGGGNGRTLATIAAAVGGGYLGDVVGKKYGY
ncbi:hypothetical protein ACFQAT_06025 [Undibacterium arcticum]|uniref:Glycine zipper 2TM domain-containing protein n=1 Tax=Undibacterium arcticum TaxID=1762892 RepID=A0ABV7F1A0_9BURK